MFDYSKEEEFLRRYLDVVAVDAADEAPSVAFATKNASGRTSFIVLKKNRRTGVLDVYASSRGVGHPPQRYLTVHSAIEALADCHRTIYVLEGFLKVSIATSFRFADPSAGAVVYVAAVQIQRHLHSDVYGDPEGKTLAFYFPTEEAFGLCNAVLAGETPVGILLDYCEGCGDPAAGDRLMVEIERASLLLAAVGGDL